MKTEQQLFSKSTGWVLKSNNHLANSAQLVLLFGNKELLKGAEEINYLKKYYPQAQLVGCSTAGEIYGQEFLINQIVCTAIYFEKTSIEIASETIRNMDESFDVGKAIAQKLNKEKLVHILLLSEGLNINGSELTMGLNSVLNNTVGVTGGLAGDDDAFNETVIVYNNPGVKNLIIGVGFYGDSLKIGYGSMGGWDSFGVDREVTKSKANVLYELDGQPALDLYKRYLGDHAANLPAAALLFPLNLRIANSDSYLVRTILSVNDADGSMTFAGDIPQGEYVRLMKANYDRLIDGANGAAEMSLKSLENLQPGLAILISCVGRRLVLKQRIEEELEIIHETLGKEVTTTGFYSYGEICPIKPFYLNCELHNQTMTITLFKEFV